MKPTPPAAVWLDERITVRASPIEGLGLFFDECIPAAVVVIRLGGRLVTTDELGSLIEAASDDSDAPFVDTITIHEDEHLLLPPNTAVHFGNHSCDPTLWHVSPYELATRRAVGIGEEATIDYGTQSGAPGFRMACGCGTQNCRRQVTSEDWRDASLRRRYEGHWVPALQDRINDGR